MDKESKFLMILFTVYSIITMFSAIFLPINTFNLILLFGSIISAIGIMIFFNLRRKISIKEIFKGEEIWETLNITILAGIYLIPLLCIVLFPYSVGWIILGLVIIILNYIAINQYHLRKVEIEK